jgi:SAM-dependent methyltransferase
MQELVAQRLIDLNRRFYQSLAQPFSETRGRLQPGVLRVLESLHGDERILDLGCGNGELAAELARRGHMGSYVGLDFSAELLEIAQAKAKAMDAEFAQADITDSGFAQQSKISDQQFNLVLAFAVLHHIPGRARQLLLLEQVRGLLVAGGRFVHSNWQFLSSKRLRGRIQPWEAAGLSEEDVDEGDYLIDWRREGRGLRYLHHFSEAELAELAKVSGFQVVETFRSDGETGDLGLYGVWEVSPDTSADP